MSLIRSKRNNGEGFTLVEVVLAIGVLSVAVLALLGMFTPTMNNVQNVLNSDFAVSATGSITAYLQRKATNDFDDVKKLVTSATDTKHSDIFLFVYIKNFENAEDIYVTTEKEEVISDLNDGLMLSSLLRVEIYEMLTNDGYNYDNINEEAYIPMMLKIFAAQPNNPEASGNLLITYPEVVTR